MPLFHGQRDAGLVHKFNMELITDIIDTEVAVYKLSIPDTKTNIYNESDKIIGIGFSENDLLIPKVNLYFDSGEING